MRLPSFPFAGGVAAVAVLVAACGGSAGSADSTPTDREAAGLAMSTQLCIMNNTPAPQNVRWTTFDTNDQKTILEAGSTTCGEGTFLTGDDVAVQIWQHDDRGKIWDPRPGEAYEVNWDVDLEISAVNSLVFSPSVKVSTIGSDGSRVDHASKEYGVNNGGHYTYTPLDGVYPIEAFVKRREDTDWVNFFVVLNCSMQASKTEWRTCMRIPEV